VPNPQPHGKSSPASAVPRPTSVPPRSLSGLVDLLDAADRLTRAVPTSSLPLDRFAELVLTGVTHDSRAVRAGDLYVGIPGASVHGASFAGTAGVAAVLTNEAGAALVAASGTDVPVLVVDEVRPVLGMVAGWLYGDPSSAMLMLGVTGTNGKTTTSYLLEAGLRAAGHRTAVIGTVECRIGDTVVPSVRTTPEAPELQSLLAVARESGVTGVGMEVSSHALAYGRVAGTTYAAVGFTNLTQDHIDFHSSLEDYFATKAKLFTPDYARVGVVNIDDAYGARLVGIATEAGLPIITVSPSGAAADWRAVSIDLGGEGSTFEIAHAPGGGAPEQRHHCVLRLPGVFNVANALLAIAMLDAAGVPPKAALAGIAELRGVPGRMERVDAGQPYLAVVDYAHTPDAVERLLAAVRPATTGKLRVVLGCGGDRDRGKRPQMGAAVARLADDAVLTNDNPRSEDPMAILDEMRAGALAAIAEGATATISVEPDRAAAIRAAVSRCRAGDTVVVAGKGHEQGQEVAGVVRPFDDRIELRRAIDAAKPWEAGR
jgi:UDP-N-acetylmuramoyl-L-alanyl-D-glutamate--2,6-diaminopimelate ligase